MKRALLFLMLLLIAGCATYPAGQQDTAATQNGGYSDPTYPGRGISLGIGIGRWGGHSGGGVGVGYGW